MEKITTRHNYQVCENEVGILWKVCLACGEEAKFLQDSCFKCHTHFEKNAPIVETKEENLKRSLSAKSIGGLR